MLNHIVLLVKILLNLLKKRFDDELIEILLKVKWWDFEPEKLVEFLPLLCDHYLKKVKKVFKEYLNNK